MRSRTRFFVALLLLAAAGVHPLVHVAMQDCPCVRVAVVTISAPQLTERVLCEREYAPYASSFVATHVVSDEPARAPPAA